jgi:hypothetical protein
MKTCKEVLIQAKNASAIYVKTENCCVFSGYDIKFKLDKQAFLSDNIDYLSEDPEHECNIKTEYDVTENTLYIIC